MKKLIPLLTVAGLTAVPMAFVLAQPQLPGANQIPLTQQGGIVHYVCQVFNWAFLALLLAAVAFVLLAAYRYLTASGDPAKVSTANKTLIFAAVAIAVALLARAIPVIVGSFVLTDNSNSTYDVCGS